MDNESITDEPAPLWPEMSSDITSARTVARSITLDTQRASTDGRVLELSSQLQAINARLLELETRIATGQGPSAPADDDGRTDRLEQEVVDLRSLIGQTSARLEQQATAPTPEPGVSNETLLSMDSRMAAVESGRVRDSEEVNQLMSYLEQAFVRLDELSNRLVENEEGLRAQVGTAESQLAAQVGEVRGVLESQVADVETNLAADVAEARQQLDEQVRQAEERLNAALADIDAGPSTESTEAIEQRLTEVDGRIAGLPGHDVIEVLDGRVGFVDMRVTDLDGRIGGVDERISDLDGRINGAGERVEGLQSQIDELADNDSVAAIDGRVNDLDGRLNDVHGRLDEVAGATNTDELGARLDDLDGRIGALTGDDGIQRVDARLDEVHARLDEVTAATNTEEVIGRIDDTNARVDNAHTRLDEVEERAGGATADVAERVGAVEERLQQLDSVQATVDGVDAALDERVDASENRLAERIQEARELLAEQQQESRDELTSRLDATEAAMAEKVSAIEEDLVAQVAEARELLAAQADDTTTVEALAAVEERVGAIEEAANNATSIAIESQHFSENLRVLQTDLVKAIQVELEGQAVRLGELEADNTSARDEQAAARTELEDRVAAAEASNGNTDARLEHLETTIVSLAAKPNGELGLAPANPLDAQRLSAVEAKLEASSSVEHGLAESLTNMTAALEQNTLEIQSLRSQLDEAHTRIAELEGSPEQPTLTFASGERAETPTPEPEPRPEGGLRVADVIGETVKEERLTPKDGSDWFVASYAKKDKGRGRFRRP
jgi:DNA repair exonuclease SbcCD ATPase subunit